MEVRRAIVGLREEQREYGEIAELLGIGEATVSRVLRRYREQGSVEPRPRVGGRRSLIHGRIAKLLVSIVTKMPDATVAELTVALAERASLPGQPFRCAESTESARLLKKKTSFRASEQDTPERRARRRCAEADHETW